MTTEKLAGITVLDVAGRRGRLPAYVFDPHRLALTSWAHALGDRPPAALLTIDRHLDLMAPAGPLVPLRAAGLRALDDHVRWELDGRNVDHVLAAMEGGIVGDAVCVARTALPGGVVAPSWTDRREVPHRIARCRALEELLDPSSSLPPLLHGGGLPILLDVDLDTFTTPSDVDPTDILPWGRDLIRRFLLPDGAARLWDALLPRVCAITVAREPLHVGGIAAANRLWDDFAAVLFEELLGADVP